MENELRNYLTKTVYPSNIDRISFVHSLGVTVCPYCNRNYINSSEEKTSAQFDHFINKSSYPILSVSFYNLVPVCSSCNHAKKMENFSYSPYDDSVTTDQLIKFSFDLVGPNYLNNTKDIKVKLKLGVSRKLQSNIDNLKLQELYQLHSDNVQELLIKKEIYTDEYQDQLWSEFRDLFGSRENLQRAITANYSNPEEYGKRPLSKMMADISKELGIIKDA